jgi:hypothetical protein
LNATTESEITQVEEFSLDENWDYDQPPKTSSKYSKEEQEVFDRWKNDQAKNTSSTQCNKEGECCKPHKVDSEQ